MLKKIIFVVALGLASLSDPIAAQTYDEGYFDYDRDGFGPVCTTYDDTVQAIIDAVHDDCAVQDAYRARMDDFFAFSDRDNCKRILKEIKKH